MDLLDPRADHREGAEHEQRRAREAGEEEPSRARVLFTEESLLVRHVSRSSTRSFALLARGFARTSSSLGPRGDGSSSAKPADSRARNVRFTMRSSPEWKEMTPSRAPTPRAGTPTRRGPGGSSARRRRREPPPRAGRSEGCGASAACGRQTARAARGSARAPRDPRRARAGARRARSTPGAPQRARPCPPSRRSSILRHAVAARTRPRPRAPEREPLHSQACQLVEERRQLRPPRPLVFVEARAIPDLKLRQPAADERDVLLEPGLLPDVGRQENSAGRVERHVLREREVQAADLAHLGAELRLLAQLRFHALPFLQRMRFQTFAVRYDDEIAVVLREHLPELRRDAQAPFRVDRVLIAPSEHVCLWRRDATSSHFLPLSGRD